MAPSRRIFIVAGLAALAAPGAAAAQAETLPVVASFSIIGDLAREIGGERVVVTTIVGPDGDAHVYQPTPADGATHRRGAAHLRQRPRLRRLARAADRSRKERGDGRDRSARASRRARVKAAPILTPGRTWPTPGFTSAEIRDALISADPAGADVYQAQAAAYLTRLAALDDEIVAALDAIPRARRRVVSTHDAFGYFARPLRRRFHRAAGRLDGSGAKRARHRPNHQRRKARIRRAPSFSKISPIPVSPVASPPKPARGSAGCSIRTRSPRPAATARIIST